MGSSDMISAFSFPPPLWGRGREGGSSAYRRRGLSLSRTLAHKGKAIAYARKPGRQSFRGHPSKRPPSASPQDEGLLRGEILNTHGEEAPKVPSRTMRPG